MADERLSASRHAAQTRRKARRTSVGRGEEGLSSGGEYGLDGGTLDEQGAAQEGASRVKEGEGVPQQGEVKGEQEKRKDQQEAETGARKTNEAPVGPEDSAGGKEEKAQSEEENDRAEGADGDEDTDELWLTARSPAKPAARAKQTPTKRRTPKKIEVILPGPSPRRPRRESSDMSAPSKGRLTSSVSSTVRDQPSVSETQSSLARGKPLSNSSPNKPISLTQRLGTPDSMADDVSSVGESSKSGSRARKTEAERMEYLQSDPLSGAVEPHRVFCTGCDKWVELNPKRRYVMQSWNAHRRQWHKQRAPSERPDAPDAEMKADADVGTDREEHDDRAEHDDREVSVSGGSVGSAETPSKPAREPHSKVATAQRKLKVVNDPQVRKLADQTAECAVCRAEVSLRGDVDFDLAKWEDHKAMCVRGTPRPIQTPERNFVYPPSPLVLPAPAAVPAPPSVASTDATAVESASPLSPVAGRKRAREEDEDAGATRAVRARGALCEAKGSAEPGLMELLMQPFRSFWIGLREGQELMRPRPPGA